MKTLPLTLLFSVSVFCLNAQSISNQVVGSAGADQTSTNYHVSWTSGEPVVEIVSGTSHMLTQGFHQPEIDLSGIPDSPDEGNLTAYPVPTDGLVSLNFQNLPKGDYQVLVYDLQGRMLSESSVNLESEQYLHSLDLQPFAAAAYLVKVECTAAKWSKTFRVIKKSEQ